MDTVRINVWSGPRNVSTALMYSFAQRPDTQVVDEPLYGHYLKVTGADHPGRDDVINTMDCDAESVIRSVILGPSARPVLFMKQMAHHLIESVDRGFLRETVNAILIRDPIDMLPSLRNQLPAPTMADTGFAVQQELLEQLIALGQDPPVLDSRRLLKNPLGVLNRLCEHVGLPFDRSMLSWSAGPRSEDGIWAKHWYKNVHMSTGLNAYTPKEIPFPDPLLPLLAECRPIYERLLVRALHA